MIGFKSPIIVCHRNNLGSVTLNIGLTIACKKFCLKDLVRQTALYKHNCSGFLPHVTILVFVPTVIIIMILSFPYHLPLFTPLVFTVSNFTIIDLLSWCPS